MQCPDSSSGRVGVSEAEVAGDRHMTARTVVGMRLVMLIRVRAGKVVVKPGVGVCKFEGFPTKNILHR